MCWLQCVCICLHSFSSLGRPGCTRPLIISTESECEPSDSVNELLHLQSSAILTAVWFGPLPNVKVTQNAVHFLQACLVHSCGTEAYLNGAAQSHDIKTVISSNSVYVNYWTISMKILTPCTFKYILCLVTMRVLLFQNTFAHKYHNKSHIAISKAMMTLWNCWSQWTVFTRRPVSSVFHYFTSRVKQKSKMCIDLM